MGFLDICSGALSFIKETATGIVKNLGSGFFSATAKVLDVVSEIFPMAPHISKCIKIASMAFKAIGAFLNIIKKDETIQDIGAKVLAAGDEGIKIDDFDNFEEFKKKIDEFQLTDEIKAKYTDEQKFLAGSSYVYLGVKETEPDLLSFGDLAYLLANDKFLRLFDENKLGDLIRIAMANNVQLNHIKSYFTGTLASPYVDGVIDVLYKVEEENNTDCNEADFLEKLHEIKQDIRK